MLPKHVQLINYLKEPDTLNHNDPILIKYLIESIGNEGQHHIQSNLFKQLIHDYVKLAKELDLKYQEVIQLSEIDLLTQIYNRGKVSKELSQEITLFYRYHHDFSIIMFDIDFFKKINDTYGHDVGDLVLVETCQIVNSHLRATDTFGRWGGEEFLIILPNTNAHQAEVVAEKARLSIANTSFPHKQNITCSFGVAQAMGIEKAHELLKRVDTALYGAKHSGRNCTVLSTDTKL